MGKDETIAHRSEIAVSTATVYNGDNFGVVLADLRKLVAAADGVPGDAEVRIQGLRRHYVLSDTYLAKRITVESTRKS